MTPGTIVKAGQINLLVLYPIKGDSRQPCTVLTEDPYVSREGIVDVVYSGKETFYLVPGIAMLEPKALSKLQTVGKAGDDQLRAIAFRPEIAHQVHSILQSEKAHQGQSPSKGPSISPED